MVLCIGLFCFAVLPLMLYLSSYITRKEAFQENSLKDLAAKQAMRLILTAKEEVVTLVIVDYPVLNMFINYYNSAKRVGIHNILPIALDEQAYHELKIMEIPVYLDTSISAATKHESGFLTQDFKLKGKMKFISALKVLRLGYAVLLSDIDIYFIKNPFPYLDCIECDFEVQKDHPEDHSSISVGFVIFRPTQRTIEFLEILIEKLEYDRTLWDQKTFREMILVPREKRNYSFNARTLSPYIFPTGGVFNQYFNQNHKMIFKRSNHSEYLVLPPKVRPNAVIYHNSWTGRSASKIYRFREMGMWNMDTPNNYYSSPTRKYLTYNNPWKSLAYMEQDILHFALQLCKLFNRTLILPKFHCYDPKDRPAYPCSLTEVNDVEAFEKVYSGRYREHSFLGHPLVPLSVKTSVSPELFISSQVTLSKHIHIIKNRNMKVLTPKSITRGPTTKELLHWNEMFSQYSVIQLHSMYFSILRLESEY